MNLSSSKNKSLDRVLLIHPFGIGDALFITPVIRTLKENGAKQIDLFLGSRTREVFEKNPNVDQIFEWNKTRPSRLKEKIKYLIDLNKLYLQIRKNRYSAVLDFSPTAKFAYLSWIYFRIPVRIGFNFKQKGIFLTHKVDLPNGYSDQFMVQYYLDLIRPLGLTPNSEKTEFFLNEEGILSAEKLLGGLNVDLDAPILAVAPGGGESWGKDARLKRWPVQHFASLIGKFFQEKKWKGTVLILGSKSESELGEELLRRLNGRSAFNLCGEFSIHTAAALLKKSSCLIANDSGLVHLAHALEVPVVAIFGPVDPNVYGPYPAGLKTLALANEGPVCRPCYQRFRYQESCKSLECLNDLTPQRVYEKINAAEFLDRIKLSAVS